VEMDNFKTLLMVPITSLMKQAPLFPDLGLGYLASAIQKAGYDVTIRSWNMEPSVSDFKKFLKMNRFSVIGIKVFTKDLSAANKTIRIIKSLVPETVIIVGGPHPSTCESAEAMTDFSDSDFIFSGEAEIGFPLLLKHISEKRNKCSSELKEIPGLIWKDGNSINSNLPVYAREIDNFGIPSWEIMLPNNYRTPRIPGGPRDGSSAPIIVTRGCPEKCSYCAAYKINGKVVRTRSSSAVLEEIELLYNKYGVKHLFFMDTCFIHNVDLVVAICDGLIRKQFDIAWDCVGYENLTNLSEDMLTLMKKAGCKCISVGIESGSDDIRKRIKKKGSAAEIFQKIKMIKNLGFRVKAFFMIGFPDETRKDVEQTVDFAFSLPADSLQFEIVCPHPSTELLDNLKQRYGIDRINWEDFDVYRSPYPLSELDSSELYRLLKKIKRRYKYMSLKRIFFGN